MASKRSKKEKEPRDIMYVRVKIQNKDWLKEKAEVDGHSISVCLDRLLDRVRTPSLDAKQNASKAKHAA